LLDSGSRRSTTTARKLRRGFVQPERLFTRSRSDASTRSLQLFEYADVVSLGDFDSENLLRVVTENKAVEREKLGGIENWNRLSHFQRGIRCGSKKKISATYQVFLHLQNASCHATVTECT
jgi:hypothetical protein